MTLLDDLTTGIDKAQTALNNNTPLGQSSLEQIKSDGFSLPATFSADGTGLPFSKVPNNRPAVQKRNIITWFIPEFGIVRMPINPNSLTISNSKLINKDRTKSGYTLSYWGENLTTINLSGSTGSTGVEGINVLYEIYRAEQYAFDGVGLSLAANNASADIANNLVNGVGGAIGGAINGLFGGDPNSPSAIAAGAGLLGGVLGLDSPTNNLAAKNIPSLAQLAFTVEMYYGGWVYRGFFESMEIRERADSFPLEYAIVFTATQRRGQRLNYFPWHKSAKDGPLEYTTGYSYSGNVTTR